MLTCLRAFFEDLLTQSVAFPFRALILYAKFTQSRFVLIKKIHLLELKICPKYLTEILKILTESFFAEVFSSKHFPPKLFVINVVINHSSSERRNIFVPRWLKLSRVLVV